MKKINLFYWSNIRLQNWQSENYGDLLSCYLVEKISGQKVNWVHPKKLKWFQKKQHYLAIGSILAQATKHSEVWGSGIISKDQVVAPAKFYAVRGPETRKRLLEQNIECPEVYGDPALLLPRYFVPTIRKTIKTGWVPHYEDLKLFKKVNLPEESALINLRTNDVEQTTKELVCCERIISSSLHGLIVAHAYGIPAIWVKLSDKLFGDDIKFRDYFESAGIVPYNGVVLDAILEVANEERSNAIFEKIPTDQQVPKMERVKELQDGLLDACPFLVN